MSPDATAIVVIGGLVAFAWLLWLVPHLWRTDRLALAICLLLLTPVGAFVLAIYSADWLASPTVSEAISAASAGVQALLAVGVLAFTAYSVQLSRHTFRTYRQERLDSTMPVLLFQLVDLNEDVDEGRTEVSIRVLNGGTGPALNLRSTWKTTSDYQMAPASPLSLAVGESVTLLVTGDIFTGMLHSLPGSTPPPEWDDPGAKATFLQLGTLSAECIDLHARRIATTGRLVITYTNLERPVREADGSIRTSRQAEHSAFELNSVEISLPRPPK
ncbi:MAG: hypothetical protein QM692_08165 [Thermomicrobiales bacterium]